MGRVVGFLDRLNQGDDHLPRIFNGELGVVNAGTP
jgi:hypothetical protein